MASVYSIAERAPVFTGVDLDTAALGRAAEQYADLGLKVFPCEARGKRPAIRRGVYGATSDPETVRRIWQSRPQCNIGLALDGLVVVDVDPRNGGPARDELRDRTGGWPHCPEQRTGGGGFHLLFRARPGLKPPASLGPGIDVKSGPGSYIIVAPSVHPSGGVYAWDGVDPVGDLRDIPLAPDWVYRAASEARGAAVPGCETIPEGQRNHTLFKLAASLRAKGLTGAAIEAALLAENRARCQPPLEEAEVLRIVESVEGRYPAGIPDSTIDTGRIQTAAEALAALNSLGVWGRLRWRRWFRRGDLFVGETDAGVQVRIPANKLGTFDFWLNAILGAAGVAIHRPRKGAVRSSWALIAELAFKAASEDYVQVAQPEDEFRGDVLRCFRLAGEPRPRCNEELYAVLSLLKRYVRDPHSDTAPPAVFQWRGRWHCRFDVLRAWLSTPRASAKFQRVDELEQHAALVGFQPHGEALQAQFDGDRVRLRTWSAPLEALDEEE